MRHPGIVEGAHDVDESVHLGELIEQRPGQPFPAGLGLQAADVGVGHFGGGRLARVKHLGQGSQPRIGDVGDGRVRLLPAGSRRYTGRQVLAGQRVEDGGLTGGRETDDAKFHEGGVRMALPGDLHPWCVRPHPFGCAEGCGGLQRPKGRNQARHPWWRWAAKAAGFFGWSRPRPVSLTSLQPMAILEVAAEVAELADARDSKSRSLGIVGSSPTFGTIRL